MGNSAGHPPSGISGTGPFSGPPESKRLPLGFRDGEAGAGLVAGLDAGAEELAEPLGLGELGGAEALHSSTVTVHVAFADPMLR